MVATPRGYPANILAESDTGITKVANYIHIEMPVVNRSRLDQQRGTRVNIPIRAHASHTPNYRPLRPTHDCAICPSGNGERHRRLLARTLENEVSLDPRVEGWHGNGVSLVAQGPASPRRESPVKVSPRHGPSPSRGSEIAREFSGAWSKQTGPGPSFCICLLAGRSRQRSNKFESNYHGLVAGQRGGLAGVILRPARRRTYKEGSNIRAAFERARDLSCPLSAILDLAPRELGKSNEKALSPENEDCCRLAGATSSQSRKL
ncbi:uncharacterized protein VTP21DRAFT_6334 [Calcarisporiella thermophila]|uniref:uncharacterized protein n=1 Tax=Calcarisporiella thermophila TaxID=911321 RepID=UPI0037448FBE